MTHSVDSSYIKIWVWESNVKNAQAAPAYGHVALETCHKSRSKYISFCVDPICKLKPPTTLNGYPAHFHEKKEDDDAIQPNKTARFYQLFWLNVSNVNIAFEQFKKNPNAWGSLGWGIFDRAYNFNDCGLTAFLLDKGKIFSDPVYQNVIVVNSLTQRVIIGVGVLYSAVNGWVGYQCRSFVQQIIAPNQAIMSRATHFKKLTDGIGLSEKTLDHVIGQLEFINKFKDLSNKVQLQVKSTNLKLSPEDQSNVGMLKQINQMIGTIAISLEDFQNIRKTVKRIRVTGTQFDAYPWEKHYEIVQKFTVTANYISKRLFVIAAVTMVALGAFQYVNNRIEGRYDARDIVLLSEKAMYAEWLHAIKTQGPLNLQKEASIQG